MTGVLFWFDVAAMKAFLWATLLSLSISASARAQVSVEKPEVWMMPPSSSDGRCLRDLFTHPEQWTETRSRIQVLGTPIIS